MNASKKMAIAVIASVIVFGGCSAPTATDPQTKEKLTLQKVEEKRESLEKEKTEVLRDENINEATKAELARKMQERAVELAEMYNDLKRKEEQRNDTADILDSIGGIMVSIGNNPVSLGLGALAFALAGAIGGQRMAKKSNKKSEQPA
jgi:PBP1b-binding outer membrane lipoprotein LpoB